MFIVCLFVCLQSKTSFVMRSGSFSITERTGSPLSKVVPKILIIAGAACCCVMLYAGIELYERLLAKRKRHKAEQKEAMRKGCLAEVSIS